jgi:hypothetical protein
MLAFVIMRDRVTYARQCVDALTAAGLDVALVDHDSTWPAAYKWLDEMRWRSEPRWPAVWSDTNRHPRDVWRPDGPIAQLVRPGERFIVTDCDVVPDPDCPADWVTFLGELLDAEPRAVKAGLGLRTDDLPEHFAHRAEVQAWEAKYQPPAAHWVCDPDGPPAAWADIDTTLAMYRRFELFRLGPAIRTTGPYLARHLPWHEDTSRRSDELAHFYGRAEHGHWRAPDNFDDTHGLEST